MTFNSTGRVVVERSGVFRQLRKSNRDSVLLSSATLMQIVSERLVLLIDVHMTHVIIIMCTDC